MPGSIPGSAMSDAGAVTVGIPRAVETVWRRRSLGRLAGRNRLAVVAALALLAAVAAAVPAPWLPLPAPDRGAPPHRLRPPLPAAHAPGTGDFRRDLLPRPG